MKANRAMKKKRAIQTTTKLWIGIGILAILSPIGLLLPNRLNAASAWGEWGTDEIQEAIGYVPDGLQRLSSLWKAALPDYAFVGWEGRGLGGLSLAYVFSGAVGIALCVAFAWLLGKFLAGKKG